MLDKLLKTYMLQNAVKDAVKFVGKQAKNIDFDADDMLHRVGLSRYKPGGVTFGGFAIFCAGACIGAVAAMLIAPKPGVQLRMDLKDRAKKYFGVEEPIQTPLGAEAQPRIQTNPNARI